MNSESESNFLEKTEFKTLYKDLPETGTYTSEFAAKTADPDFQKIFHPHFKRIKLINCHNLKEEEDNNSKRPTYVPKLFARKDFSGPVALDLAHKGKKVAVLIFADSTNVGGIYITGYSPANTQEEQTVLMAPEIYGYLGNNYGVHDIGGNGDGCYLKNQKRYCLNKDDYENPDIINPAYGYILTNLLITHNVKHSMIKLPEKEVVEVSYAFLSMPSFATSVSRDPIGAMLIGNSGEKDGEKIYENIKNASNSLYQDETVKKYSYDYEMTQNLGKLAIFYSIEKLEQFSKKYLGEERSVSDILSLVIKADILFKHSKEEKELKELILKDFKSFKKDVKKIMEEADMNYRECVLRKFTNLIKGTEKAGADTLVLGKIGCGAFLNDENVVSELMGKAIATSKYIEEIYFAGLDEEDPFFKSVKKAMKSKKKIINI